MTNSYSNYSYKVILSLETLENKFMLNFIKLLVILININQETLLNWFGIRDTDILNKNLDISNGKVESTSGLSISTLELIFRG